MTFSSTAKVDALAEVLPTLEPPTSEGEFGRLAGFRLLSVLGSGGTGVVFAAEAHDSGAPVAVKVLRPSLTNDPVTRERFVRQSGLLRGVGHENLVAIHSFGLTSGTLYTVMELIRGESLEARLKRVGKLNLPELLHVGQGAARALVALHGVGLIHRDVKPANLMLDEERSSTSLEGDTEVADPNCTIPTRCVRLLDYGLVQWDDSQTAAAVTAQLVGTPGYLSPEQAQEESVNPRSDLFSLGCVLYRAATGEVPFQGEDIVSAMLAAVDHVPTPIHVLRPDLPPAFGELVEWLMEKKPNDRPKSAAEVDRILTAIAEGRSPRLRRPRRTRARKRLAALTVLLLASVGVAGVVQFNDKPQPVLTAEAEPAVNPVQPAQPTTPQPTPTRPAVPKPLEVIGNNKTSHVEQAAGLTFSPDGATLVSGGKDGAIKIWDATTGELRRNLIAHTGQVNGLGFAAGGKTFVSAAFDGTVKVWDSESGQERWTLRGHTQLVLSLAVSPDGKTAASGSFDSTIRVWNLETGIEIAILRGLPGGDTALAYLSDNKTLLVGVPSGEVLVWDYTRNEVNSRIKTGQPRLWWLAVSDDDNTLASASANGTVKIWDLRTGTERHTLYGHTGEVSGAVFLSGNKRLFTGGWDGRVIEWDVETGDPLRHWELGQPIHRLARSPDGTRVAAARRDGRIQLLNSTPTPATDIPNWGQVINPTSKVSITPSPRGLTFTLPGGNFDLNEHGTVNSPRVLQPVEGDFDITLPVVEDLIGVPDNEQPPNSGYRSAGILVSIGPEKWIRLERVYRPGAPRRGYVSYRVLHHLRTATNEGRILPDDTKSVSLRLSRRGAEWRATVGIQTTQASGVIEQIFPAVTWAAPDRVRVGLCAVNTSQSPLATTFRPLTVATGANLQPIPSTPIAPPVVVEPPLSPTFGPDALPKPWVAAMKADGSEVPPETVALLGGTRYRVTGNAELGDFSPDGRLYISVSGSDLFLFDARTGNLVRRFVGHRAQCCSVRFNPTADMIVSVGHDRTIRLWDVETGREKQRFDTSGLTWRTALSPDGKYLATSVILPKGEINLIDLKSGKQRQFDVPVGAGGVAFLNGGEVLAVGCSDAKVRFLSVATGQLLHTLTHPAEPTMRLFLTLSPDKQFLAGGTERGTVVWRIGDDLTKTTRIWQSNTPGVGLLAFTPDGASLWTAKHELTDPAAPQFAVRWRAKDGMRESQVELVSRTGFVTYCLSPDGKQIIGGGGPDRVLWIYDVTSPDKKPKLMEGHNASIFRLAVSGDGKSVASADGFGRVRLWNPVDGRGREYPGHRGIAAGLAFLADGKAFLSVGRDSIFRLRDITTQRPVGEWGSLATPLSVATSPDGESFAASDSAGHIGIFTPPVRLAPESLNFPGWPSTKSPMSRLLVGHVGQVFGVAYNSDGTILATGGSDGTVRVWPLAGGTPRVMQAYDNGSAPPVISSVAILPSGEIVSSSADSTLRFWSAEGQPGVVVRTPSPINAMRVRSDGRLLATAGPDGTVRVWTLMKGKAGLDPNPRVIRLATADRVINAMEFAPDGCHLVVAGPDGLVHILRIVEQAPLPRTPATRAP
ncbi:MAG: protein kinase [Planctomycetes bacterium]|nr:protein kinase [Planctomycetota bacterium]